MSCPQGNPEWEQLSVIWSQATLITEYEPQKLRLEKRSAEYHPADEDDSSSEGHENTENV